MTEPGKGGQFTTQLLVDLAANPLDPGYAAAAQRRGGAPAPDGVPHRAAVAIGCALIGFLLVVAYVHTHRSAPQTAKVHNGLVSRVRAEQHSVASLSAQEQKLGADINAVRAQALGGSGELSGLDRSQLQAGLVAVTGPGLEVDLREPTKPTASASAGRGGTTSIGQTNILTDRDVRSVVNELWHDGAEAISVNGIRLTPTSAIRFAGEAVLVDFQPITSPYVIRAIGNADDLATSFASSEVASRYHTLVSADGIGFDFSEHSRMSLPAGTPVTPRYATQQPTPSSSSSGGTK
jgi:uncharacterized protein YlxW (UPF0749 family)